MCSSDLAGNHHASQNGHNMITTSHLPQTGLGPTYQPPTDHKFSGLAWSSVVLGTIGVIDSTINTLNNLTAVMAGAGVAEFGPDVVDLAAREFTPSRQLG